MTTRTRRRRGGGSSGGRPQAQRRAVEWFDFHVNQTLAAASQMVLTLDANLGNDVKKGATIVRCLLDLWIMPVTADTGGTAGMGLAIFNDEALAASAVADTDAADDRTAWLWKVFFPFFTTNVSDKSQSVRFKEDLRGMRKYPSEDHSLALIGDNATGTTSFNIDGLVRFLVKKP